MDKCVLTKAEIDAFEGVDKVHFLNAKAQRNNKSLGDLTGITGFGFHIIEVPAGCDSTEEHVHYFEDECVYMLEGQAQAVIGDDIFTVSPGDFIGYPAGGESHLLRNVSDQPFKCIVVGQRLDHDVADYPSQKKRIYRNAGMAWNLVDHDAIDTPNAGKKV